MRDPVWDRVGSLCGQLGRWPELAGIIGDAGARSELTALTWPLTAAADPQPEQVTEVLDATEQAVAASAEPDLMLLA